MENNNDDILGIKGIESTNLHAGVGYVIIPEGVDRDEYIEDVYRSGKISIYGGYGHSNFYDIHIDREVLQRIIFPAKPNQNGSPVVWINIPKHNEPVVISVLKYDEVIHSLSQYRKRITRSIDGSMVDIDLDAQKSKITISATGNRINRGEIEINLGSLDNNGILKLDINGEVLVRSSDRIVQISEKKIEVAVTDKSGITKAFTRMSSEKDVNRFEYQDEFENAIIANGELINISSKKINHNEGKEPMVLGNTLATKLGELIDAINKLTVPTNSGPSGTPINSAEFTKIKNSLDEIKSKISNLD